MTPLQLTRSVRSLNRLRHIARVLTQHGFGYIVAQLNLARFVPVWMLRRKPVGPAALEAGAAKGKSVGSCALASGSLARSITNVVAFETTSGTLLGGLSPASR